MKIIDDDGKVIAEGQVLSLEPSDILVFQTKRKLPQGSLEGFAAQLTRLFPDNRTVVLGPGDGLSILRQPAKEIA